MIGERSDALSDSEGSPGMGMGALAGTSEVATAKGGIELGDRCWCILERFTIRGVSSQRRVLVELKKIRGKAVTNFRGRPAQENSCDARVINSERVCTVSRSDVEPLAEAERESLQQLEQLGVSEAELAKALAGLAEKALGLSEVRWERERNGNLTGERKNVAPKPHFGCPARQIRLGKKCGTPGCTFTDFHHGPCSHEFDLEPRKRRRT